MVRKKEMLTPRQYADRVGVAYTTVMNWLRQGLIAGAVKEEMPFGGYVYQVPADASKPDLKSGPKPKKKGVKGKG